MKVFALLFLLPFASAECPNACSGHGECGQYDSCDCYTGFQGGDCSERVCAYNWAWVTTANGDLNFDGDRFDGTVYSEDVKISSTNEALQTQAAPGGTWEAWPYYAAEQEGHFYMECSNRGLCDRQTGECQCFDGYDGHACNRMACPENCNGRGRCKSVDQRNSAYKFWDGAMARDCECDAGFTGPTCAERQCPFGNDVLTQTNELYEVQYIEIFTECESDGGSACTGAVALRGANDGLDGNSLDGQAAYTSDLLGGSFTLTYTDHFGESYTTAAIAVTAYDGSATVADATELALEGLPNNVIDSGVEVTASACSYVEDTPLAAAITDGVLSGDANWDATAIWSTAADDTLTHNAGTGKFVANPATAADQGVATTTATTTTQTFNRHKYPICIRLKVAFNGMPGNLANLLVDHSAVSYHGVTNSQINAAAVGSSVVSSLMVTGGGAGTNAAYNLAKIGYMNPSLVTVTASTASIAGSIITWGAVSTITATQDAATTFYAGSVVEVFCTDADATVNIRSLGYYTIDSTTDAATTMLETFVANTCNTAGDETVTMTQISNVISIGGEDGVAPDLTAGTNDLEATTTALRVGISTKGAAPDVYTFDSKINPSLIKHQTILSGGTAGTEERTWIILNDDYTKMTGATKTSSGVVTVDEYLATAVVAQLFVDGDGTMENNECGDRGLCDSETGECKCFAGYTGDACHIQKSISA